MKIFESLLTENVLVRCVAAAMLVFTVLHFNLVVQHAGCRLVCRACRAGCRLVFSNADFNGNLNQQYSEKVPSVLLLKVPAGDNKQPETAKVLD